ncbi:hypothetical protein EON79_12365 [bacterium]|nr:MAG: hypothetical protein EON79_12365 [bacterium]
MRPDQLPRVLVILAAVILTVLLGVLIAVPKATPFEGITKAKRDLSKSRVKTAIARSTGETAATVVRLRTWTGSAGTIASASREKLTAIALRQGVRISSFRPQRENTGGELSQLPFVATVEGPFPNVVRFIRETESPTNKLAVNLVQISSSDDATDRVTATVGMFAYMAPKEPANG